MTIWEAPVTQLYGYDPTYPLNGGFHKGVDYGAAVGTPVTVNGQVIGLSGNTGASTGPHCHVGHWNGSTSIPNQPQDGKNVDGATVTQIDTTGTTDNGKFVRVGASDGSNWVYLHLSEVKVKVGDKIGGDMPISSDALDRLIKGMTGRDPSADELNNPTYHDNPELAILTFWENGGKQHYAEVQSGTTNVKPYSGPQLYVKE